MEYIEVKDHTKFYCLSEQDFNHLYVKFTNNKKGIRLRDRINTSGGELKEFLEFAIRQALASVELD